MEITETIFEQYEKIRVSGVTNMWHERRVQQLASEREFHELVTFIEDGDYDRLLKNYGELQDRFAPENPEEHL